MQTRDKNFKEINVYVNVSCTAGKAFFQNYCKVSLVVAPSYVNKKQHFIINISVINMS